MQNMGLIGMMTVEWPLNLRGIFSICQFLLLDIDSYGFSCIAGHWWTGKRWFVFPWVKCSVFFKGILRQIRLRRFDPACEKYGKLWEYRILEDPDSLRWHFFNNDSGRPHFIWGNNHSPICKPQNLQVNQNPFVIFWVHWSSQWVWPGCLCASAFQSCSQRSTIGQGPKCSAQWVPSFRSVSVPWVLRPCRQWCATNIRMVSAVFWSILVFCVVLQIMLPCWWWHGSCWPSSFLAFRRHALLQFSRTHGCVSTDLIGEWRRCRWIYCQRSSMSLWDC